MPARRRRPRSPSSCSSPCSSSAQSGKNTKRRRDGLGAVTWEFDTSGSRATEKEWLSFARPAQEQLTRAYNDFLSAGAAPSSSRRASSPQPFNLRTCEAEYAIDFQNMQQRNVYTGRIRSIRKIANDPDSDMVANEARWERMVSKLKEGKDEAEEIVRKLKEDNQKIVEEKHALRDTLGVEQERREKMESRLKRQLKEARANILELEGKNKEKDEQLGSVGVELQDVQAKLGDMQKDRDKRRDRLEAQLKTANTKLNKMEENHTKCKDQLDSLQDEAQWTRGQLDSARDQLKANNRKLHNIEDRKEEEEKVVACTLRRQMEAWRLGRTLDGVPRLVGIHDTSLFTEIKHMFARTAHGSTHNGQRSLCGKMRHVDVVDVYSIVNLTLWNEYGCIKRRVQDAHAQRGRHGLRISTTVEPSISRHIQNALAWIDLDESLGEQLLLHGTTNLEAIKEHGFNERFGRGDNLYGEGVYFSDESCKASMYSGDDDDIQCIIVARVILGEPYYAEGPRVEERRAPLREQDDPVLGCYESVVANVGIYNGIGSTQQQQHRELIVYDGKQAYPELAIHFRFRDDSSSESES